LPFFVSDVLCIWKPTDRRLPFQDKDLLELQAYLISEDLLENRRLGIRTAKEVSSVHFFQKPSPIFVSPALPWPVALGWIFF
jgi:hypothetical protein